MSLKSPVLSIDCKKKDKLGNFYRDEKCYGTAPEKVFDHNYEHLSDGKIIPHGIYDLQANECYISIGNNRGANSYRHHLFKHRLLRLADETGCLSSSVIIRHIARNRIRLNIDYSAKYTNQCKM